ncbi:MAG: hypothetical protein FWC49_04515, partial [Proteobacteria bacterium]|nr:hypothetical protein [Pseudomonadota bacterium]
CALGQYAPLFRRLGCAAQPLPMGTAAPNTVIASRRRSNPGKVGGPATMYSDVGWLDQPAADWLDQPALERHGAKLPRYSLNFEIKMV